MNSKTIWQDKVPEREGAKSSINDIAISPDGKRCIVAVGNRVLFYNAENGDLIESLRGNDVYLLLLPLPHSQTISYLMIISPLT